MPALRLPLHPTSPTSLYALSLHDALPIFTCPTAYTLQPRIPSRGGSVTSASRLCLALLSVPEYLTGLPSASDRKSTRLNSSHVATSYAVFCLKKKKRQLNAVKAENSCRSR